jgi:hypothetical protein
VPRSLTIRGTILLLLSGSATLAAQTSAAAALGATLQRQDGGFWRSSTRIDPAARFDNPWLQLGGDASLAGNTNGGGLRVENASFSALGSSPGWRGFRISNTARVERLTAGPAIARTASTAESAVSYHKAGSGAWMGFGLEQVPELDSGVTRPLLRAGLWRQFRSVVVSVSTDQHAMRTGLRQSSGRTDTLSNDSTARTMVWSDVQARVGWSGGRVALDARAGLARQLNSRPEAAWGRITATTALAPRLSVVAALGTDPTRAWIGMPPSRFASLGLRFAPAALSRPAPPPHIQPNAANFTVRAAETGSYVVSMHVPDARTVELSGDFNGWHAVSLRQVTPDVWETTLPIAPGTYHVNVRVNGDHWTAPPGLAMTTDDFNGTVGLLVIR